MAAINYSAGSHIKVKRWKGCYTHHGITDGNGNVIHFCWNPETKSGVITVDKLIHFSKGTKTEIIHSESNTTEVLKRAYSKLGETGYNLLTNNCEHFAEWCITGIKKSQQSKRAIKTFSTIIALFLISNLVSLI